MLRIDNYSHNLKEQQEEYEKEEMIKIRINYYRFPPGVPEEIMLSEGCGVVLKSGDIIYPDTIPEEKRELVDHIDLTIDGITVTAIKKLIRQYGGCGWTEHIDRDGGLFEVTEITLKGNNSRFKYNRHL